MCLEKKENKFKKNYKINIKKFQVFNTPTFYIILFIFILIIILSFISYPNSKGESIIQHWIYK